MCAALSAYGTAQAADKENTDRPNILWLTFEDTSAAEFSCYGNNGVHTPNSDNLAAQGIQFMNAWSVAPQSSPARSSLITGCYATTYGMDIHPRPYDTPNGIFFPQWLREAGYYCTNNNKTHYNTTVDNTSCWDECDRQASYHSQNRKEGQPFFAVYNTATSHMGRVRTFHTEGRRNYADEGIHQDSLVLPSYVPDLPEVRSDYAGHLEAVQDVDTWLGFFLQDLKDSGLDDNTIIFFFSDHGGCLPRGKGYLYESGLKVPMIVYFPPKWRHLAGKLPNKCNDLVNFTDLGPTVLSIAGVQPPAHMQGKALFGQYADQEKRDTQVAFAGNQLHHYMPVRAVTDGRFKYIRSYIPYRQFALRNYYQWGMPSNKAWDKSVLSGTNTNPDWELPFQPHPAEMLFDLTSDPGEIHDLSTNPEYASVLEKMRQTLSGHVRNTKDLGFFLPSSRTGHTLYDKVREESYPLNDLYEMAEMAGTATSNNIRKLAQAIESPLPEMRFWGVVGYTWLARRGQISECPGQLLKLIDDDNPYIAAEAAYAASYLGHSNEGIARMLNPKNEQDRTIGYSALECLSLDPGMRANILNFAPALKDAAETLPRKANEDPGLMARGILVNLGEMDINDLHGPEAYKQGLKLNKGRRAMNPRPL